MRKEENPVVYENYLWPKLREYRLSSDEQIELIEGKIEKVVGLLGKFKPNQFLVVRTLPASRKNVEPFEKYIAELKELGLDIGKGSAEYGFKMPLPKRRDLERELIIFRRP